MEYLLVWWQEYPCHYTLDLREEMQVRSPLHAVKFFNVQIFYSNFFVTSFTFSQFLSFFYTFTIFSLFLHFRNFRTVFIKNEKQAPQWKESSNYLQKKIGVNFRKHSKILQKDSSKKKFQRFLEKQFEQFLRKSTRNFWEKTMKSFQKKFQEFLEKIPVIPGLKFFA